VYVGLSARQIFAAAKRGPNAWRLA